MCDDSSTGSILEHNKSINTTLSSVGQFFVVLSPKEHAIEDPTIPPPDIITS